MYLFQKVMQQPAVRYGQLLFLVHRRPLHIEKDIRAKCLLVQELSKTKDESLEKGRVYAAAYVNYTHTLEGLESALKGHEGHSAGKH